MPGVNVHAEVDAGHVEKDALKLPPRAEVFMSFMNAIYDLRSESVKCI
jgi:hypothetical protein